MIRSPSGALALIPTPKELPQAAYPRIASAGKAGWHFTFVVGKLGTRTNALAFDSASIWYGRYDGRGWHDVRSVATASAASLLPGVSSDLVATDDEVAFVYAFDPVSTAKGADPRVQGVVMLRHHNGRWLSDTLLTWEAPSFIQLVHERGSALRAVFTQSYFASGRSHPRSLFTVQFKDGWAIPELLLEDSLGYIGAPLIASGDSPPRVVGWRRASFDKRLETVGWGELAMDGSLRVRGDVAAFDPSRRVGVVETAAHHTLLFIPSDSSRSELRVSVIHDGAIDVLRMVHVPAAQSLTIGASLPDGRVLIVTGGLGSIPTEPPASSYLTALAVHCGATP
ncbi:MAG: hypothetical protein ABJE47_12575 [bacterium]